MHELAGRAIAGDRARGRRAESATGSACMGLLQQDPAAWFQRGVQAAEAVEAAIAERLAARKSRDFARADAIRAEWLARGVAFEDRPDGSTEWRRVAATA